MTSSRDGILGRVRERAIRAKADRGPGGIPFFDQAGPVDLAQSFQANLETMGGKIAAIPAEGGLRELVRILYPEAKVVCSAVPELQTGLHPRDFASPREAARVDVTVVRASFGVAETGSVFLSEKELGVGALGFLAEHILILLDPSQIVTNIHRAYARDEFRDAAYSVLMTGPSATADIQGVLIRGAQGVRTLTVVFNPA